MIQADRKKFSERQTLSLALSRYKSYEQFEAAYTGFTDAYAMLLREDGKEMDMQDTGRQDARGAERAASCGQGGKGTEPAAKQTGRTTEKED
ncbi:unnamed protein product [Aphanomyces euteiches]